jgi:hypothetical protein
MNPQIRTFKLVTGLSFVAGIAILAGAWVPGNQTPKFGNPKIADASCDCGPSALVAKVLRKPGPAPAPDPRAWCITQELYDARKGLKTELGPRALCPQDGPPDDPAVRDAAIPTAATPIRTYRLSLHVFRENDGSNPAATEAQIIAAMDDLNADYLPSRIQFVYEWRYINNSKYRHMDTGEEWQMKKTYALSPTTKLNMFVVNQLQGYSWGTFPWDAQSLTFMGGIVFSQSHFTNGGTPAHEVGHCLGLWHTFHGVSEVPECSDCYEPAGRSAEVGDTTGDKCSDTNPTPRHFPCTQPTSLDPCSGLSWGDTPLENFMGYSGCAPQDFTPQQGGRMHAWTTQSLMGWVVPPPPPVAPGTPSLIKSGSTVTVSWSDNSGDESGFEVQREKKGNGNKCGSTTTVANVGANVTSTTDAPGTGTFRYRVRAYNGNGSSDWSGWAQVTF